MITPDISYAKDLREFYVTLETLQRAAHGEKYTAIHDTIEKHCNSETRYKEFGTMQGCTAASAVLADCFSIHMVDINLSRYEPYKKLFEDWCSGTGQKLIVQEASSLEDRTYSECDFLLIDSMHKPSHLIDELNKHSSSVQEYIACHDTASLPDMHEAIEKFCSNDINWEIDHRNTQNVGYTLMIRTGHD